MFIDSEYYYYKYIDNSIYKILSDSSFKLTKNEKGIIEFNEIKFEDTTIKYEELSQKKIPEIDKFKKSYEKWLQLLNVIKYELNNKSKDMDIFNLELIFKIENENNSKDSNLFNLTCIYKLNAEPDEFKDEDILKYKKISDSKDGFLQLIKKISEYYKDINNSGLTDSNREASNSNNYSNSNKLNENMNSNTSNHNSISRSSRDISSSNKNTIFESNISIISTNKIFRELDKIREDKCNKKNIFNIIELVCIIEMEKGSESEFIYETKNGFLIVGFLNGKLVLYNQNLGDQKELIIKNEPSRRSISIYETNESKENEVNLIVCSKLSCRTLVIKFKDKKFEEVIKNDAIILGKSKKAKETSSVCFQMGERNNIYVLGGEKGICLIYLNQNEMITSHHVKGVFHGGIKINDKVFALTSNYILPNGENKIVFYEVNKVIGIIKEIKSEEYSFTVSTNSLAKMQMHKINESESMTYLLCGCKKYNYNQKNGILLIELNSKQYNKEDFIDTEDFEVYCFCPISMTLKNSDNTIEFYPTNYFFVGGFDDSKRRGAIRLYRLKDYDQKIKIEYLQDIIFEQGNEYKFDMNVSCIIQSKYTGEILVTCWNGKIYKFSSPNIIYYLDYEYNDYKNKGYNYLKYDKNKDKIVQGFNTSN